MNPFSSDFSYVSRIFSKRPVAGGLSREGKQTWTVVGVVSHVRVSRLN